MKKELLGLIVFLGFLLVNVTPGIAAEQVTLEMWSHWGGEALKMRFIEETIQSFETLYPQVKIDLHWINKNRMNQTLQASLPKGEGPDVFYSEPYPFQANPWVKGGYLLDLKNKLDWSRFEPSAYQLFWEYPDGGIYGVPIEVGEYAIYYNKAIFADAGITIPPSGKFTTDEFLQIVKAFRAKGIIPIAVGNQDRGTASSMLFHGLLLRFAGAEKIRGLQTKNTLWTDADIVAAFTYMKQLLDAGVFPEEMNRLTYQEGRDLFVQGKSAMYVEGTWFFGKIADEQGALPPGLQGKLGAMDYPTAPNGKGNEAIERFTGGSFVIRKGSAHTPEAVQLLEVMTSQENALKWVKYTQSPCGMKIGFAEHVSLPFLQELFQSRGEVKDVIVPGTESLLGPETYKVWVRDVGIAFLGGNLAVEEVVQRLAKVAQTEP
jgi:ABC-type glycerol-3-phosphate transport system substrate-binding protein